MALLDGCRVLDLTEGGSMIAGRMLADLGADVVQVEAPGGSSSRALGPGVTGATWTALAANKRGIVLDLSLEAGRSDLERLVAAADILIESSNGALAAHGLGYDRCARRNPRLVYVSISPYGAAGPKAGYAATDLTVWAAGGPLALNRDDQDRPLRISSDQAFLHAGADAACGALVAYDVAERTGRGQLVDVSAQASLTICTLGRILAAAVGDDHPDPEVIKAKVDQSGSGTGTRRSKWPCADGLIEFHLAMGGAAGSFTNRFFAWMREEGEAVPAELDWDWTALPPRIESGEITPALIEQVRARVSAFLRVRTKAEVMAAAMSRRLLCVGIADTADLVGSEHFAARGFWCEMGEGTRRVRLPGRFVRSEIDLYRFRGPAPLVGEHDTEVRAEWEARPVAGAPAAPLPREGALA